MGKPINRAYQVMLAIAHLRDTPLEKSVEASRSSIPGLNLSKAEAGLLVILEESLDLSVSQEANVKFHNEHHEDGEIEKKSQDVRLPIRLFDSERAKVKDGSEQ